MNKYEATSLFSKELNKNGYISIITDKSLKKEIKKAAISFQISEDKDTLVEAVGRAFIENSQLKIYPTMKSLPKNAKGDGMYFYIDYSGSQAMHSGYAEDICREAVKENLIKKVNFANYIFAEEISDNNPFSGSTTYLFRLTLKGTPLSIITLREVSILKEMYKGDLSGGVREAAKTLGIEADLDIDYFKLLQNQAEKFYNYFKEVSDIKKREIVKEVTGKLDTKSVPEVFKELSREYKHIFVEAARDELERESRKTKK